ncbi:hypothetical protein B0H14DRAFT_2601045 [Mycena olivaceomarginata]|nr:hypothetical protein B0H14DRAFT_2601045 [Mycena olivaceomarginata]
MTWKATGELAALLWVPEIRNLANTGHNIALQLDDQEGLKPCLTGGWWLCDQGWQRAGVGVRGLISAHPMLQKLLGWTEEKASETHYGHYTPELNWIRCTSVASKSLDECFVGSWIFAQSAIDKTHKDSTISGCISDILTNEARTTIVVLELFQVLLVMDPLYDMPVLVHRNFEITFHIVPFKNIKFKINVQHDCYTTKCEATSECLCMQEHIKSDNVKNFIMHGSLDRFIINSHAFYNAHLLHTTLPRDLLALIPLFEDWKEKHGEFAEALHQKNVTKIAKKKAQPAGKKKAVIITNT